MHRFKFSSVHPFNNTFCASYLVFLDLEDIFSFFFSNPSLLNFKNLCFLPEIVFFCMLLYSVFSMLYDTPVKNNSTLYYFLFLLLFLLFFFKVGLNGFFFYGVVFIFNFCFVNSAFTSCCQILLIITSLFYLRLSKKVFKKAIYSIIPEFS